MSAKLLTHSSETNTCIHAFPKVQNSYETQTVASNIPTRLTDTISNDNNRYSKLETVWRYKFLDSLPYIVCTEANLYILKWVWEGYFIEKEI